MRQHETVTFLARDKVRRSTGEELPVVFIGPFKNNWIGAEQEVELTQMPDGTWHCVEYDVEYHSHVVLCIGEVVDGFAGDSWDKLAPVDGDAKYAWYDTNHPYVPGIVIPNGILSRCTVLDIMEYHMPGRDINCDIKVDLGKVGGVCTFHVDEQDYIKLKKVGVGNKLVDLQLVNANTATVLSIVSSTEDANTALAMGILEQAPSSFMSRVTEGNEDAVTVALQFASTYFKSV